MTIFYAKPDQTYREHVEEVYRAWLETVAAKRLLIERTAERYGFSVERFLKGSLLTIVLHDLGKMIIPFQAMMTALREGKKYNRKDNYRHELVSFVFTAYAAYILSKEEFFAQVPVEALAVAGHHRSLNTDLNSFKRERGAPGPAFSPGGLKEALSLASEIFQRHNWLLPEMSQDLAKEKPYNRLASLFDPLNNIIDKLLERNGYEKTRDLYILLKGILHYADWHASGKSRVSYSVEKPPEFLLKELARRCREKKILFAGLRPFQIKMADYSGHLLAVAPTGSGKTEGSLLWALKNTQEMGRAKIIYLLPTMNTANQIWKRLADLFGQENVGLTHSTANLFLSGENEEGEGDSWEDRRNLLFDRAFLRPVTVGTVDQLLSAGFNIGHWVLKEINASNAAIVFDEVHTYDGWTLGLITSSIRHFAERGSRFLLMSATMPEMLVDLFKSELPGICLISEETMLGASRSRYQVVDAEIEEAGKRIADSISSGRRVLVVVNTVEKCQQLAQYFAGLRPVCYHSRYILKDRKRIEKEIENSRFVIATQVVEVSLDIDYDWLFTECAPPDAIAQRAGRVNRYRDQSRDSRVFIFKYSTKAEKLYNPINDPELLKRSYEAFRSCQGRLCEKDLIDIVDEVYKGFRIDQTEAFCDAVVTYRQTRQKRMAIFDHRLGEDEQEMTRQSKYDTVSVIPTCFFEEVINLPPAERRWYEVKVPLWYFLKNKKMYNGLYFCDLEYDQHLGALLKPSEDKAALLL